MLKNAEVVGASELTLDKIGVGTKVKVYDEDEDEEMEFTIVGSSEANTLQHRISNVSPVGAAMIGHKVDDIVEVVVPSGSLQYRVISIEHADQN